MGAPECHRIRGCYRRRMLEAGHELTFIQVGGFDGITTDPLYKYITRYGWRGVLLEPQSRALISSASSIAAVTASLSLSGRTSY